MTPRPGRVHPVPYGRRPARDHCVAAELALTPFPPHHTKVRDQFVTNTISPRRAALALLALALGGFGIGCTEFASMGLLPQIGSDLIDGFAAAPEASIAQAGQLVSVYALGVVVGAPTIAAFTSRMSRTTLALWLLVWFVLATAASAAMPTFGSTLLMRFLAGLPHGAYFGVASLLAAQIMGPGQQGKGIALALSGLTVANVVGVPAVTWVGHTFDWRVAYLSVAVVFLVTLVLGYLVLPRFPGDPSRSARTEMTAFRNGQLWLMIVIGCIGFGGFFAVYSYLSEMAVRLTHLSEHSVPWLLAVVGIGMTIGNLVGGRVSDSHPTASLMTGFASYMAALVLFSLTAAHPVGLFVSAGLVGATSSLLLVPVQTRLIAAAGASPLMGAATNHAAFNVGNSLGAALGGAVIAAGLGYRAPGWAGLCLAALGFLGLGISLLWERRTGRLVR
jgi:DHA1 family inner membrane transport protein